MLLIHVLYTLYDVMLITNFNLSHLITAYIFTDMPTPLKEQTYDVYFCLLQIIFAMVPPPSILGGWLCFIVSLGAIGLLTAIIGDLASIFGCLVGLKDSVTGEHCFFLTFFRQGISLT